MAQLSDDLRFQELPPEDVREQIKQSMDKAGWKYILIEHTTWYNQKTRCKHDIYNMPIIALSNTSNRPKAINEIYVETRVGTGAYWEKKAHYTYNRDYVHVNICCRTSSDSGCIELRDKDDENKRYKIYYESICNPITQSHFFTTKSLDELKLIFTGQLMGQNNNSPFRTVDSVAGTYYDRCITVQNSTTFIKRSAPILQLLTRASIYDLQKKEYLIKKLQEVHFPTENEVACKLIGDGCYSIRTKKEMEELKEKKQLSAYYPIITHEMCTDIINNIPKMDIEFGCFGLGSAGTGVLDLLSRSIFFDSYLLVDFDTVESKNLRNQWYTRNSLTLTKTRASEAILRNRKVSFDTDRITIITYNKKFQEVPLQNFNFVYVFSAFDSIEARLEFVKTLHDNKIEARYLIDTRYDDLTASIFFIDMKQQDQVDYYLNGLIEDKKAFDNLNKDKIVKTADDFIAYLEAKRCFESSCSKTQRMLVNKIEPTAPVDKYFECPDTSCGNDRCKEMYKKFFEEHIKDKITLYKTEEESSCVRQNFMDIYHFASTFVFDAIRQIEDKQPKPFTHVDVTTDPLPKSLLIRK